MVQHESDRWGGAEALCKSFLVSRQRPTTSTFCTYCGESGIVATLVLVDVHVYYKSYMYLGQLKLVTLFTIISTYYIQEKSGNKNRDTYRIVTQVSHREIGHRDNTRNCSGFSTGKLCTGMFRT